MGLCLDASFHCIFSSLMSAPDLLLAWDIEWARLECSQDFSWGMQLGDCKNSSHFAALRNDYFCTAAWVNTNSGLYHTTWALPWTPGHLWVPKSSLSQVLATLDIVPVWNMEWVGSGFSLLWIGENAELAASRANLFLPCLGAIQHLYTPH